MKQSKKLQLKKLIISNLSEDLMNSIFGGDGDTIGTVGERCTVMCLTEGANCTKDYGGCDRTEQCPSVATQCFTVEQDQNCAPQQSLVMQCNTADACTQTFCTAACPDAANFTNVC